MSSSPALCAVSAQLAFAESANGQTLALKSYTSVGQCSGDGAGGDPTVRLSNTELARSVRLQGCRRWSPVNTAAPRCQGPVRAGGASELKKTHLFGGAGQGSPWTLFLDLWSQEDCHMGPSRARRTWELAAPTQTRTSLTARRARRPSLIRDSDAGTEGTWRGCVTWVAQRSPILAGPELCEFSATILYLVDLGPGGQDTGSFLSRPTRNFLDSPWILPFSPQGCSSVLGQGIYDLLFFTFYVCADVRLQRKTLSLQTRLSLEFQKPVLAARGHHLLLCSLLSRGPSRG